jgi:hypothetical protein
LYTAVRATLDSDKRIQITLSRPGEASTVQKRCDTHAFPQEALLILYRKTFFLGVVIRSFQSAVEQFFKIDWFLHYLFGGGGLPRLQKISPSNLDGRETDGLRDAIHVSFHRKQALWRPKSAERAVRRRICGNGPRANPNAWPIVGSASMNGSARKHYRRQSEVGAAVNCEVDLATENLPVAADGSAVASAGRMPLRRRHHVFHSVVNNLNRPFRLDRKQGSMSRNH